MGLLLPLLCLLYKNAALFNLPPLIAFNLNTMSAIAEILVILGLIIAIVYGFIILIKAFQVSIFWGLGCIILSFPVSLISVIIHWDDCKKPFLMNILGSIIMIIGIVLGRGNYLD